MPSGSPSSSRRRPALAFGGLQGYHGSAQHLRTHDERAAAVDSAAQMLRATALLLNAAGLPYPVVTGGGTGTVDIDVTAGVWTELQVGSYAFMDADYGRNLDRDGTPVHTYEQALFVLATVMSAARPGVAVVDAGLKALAVDSGLPLVHDRPGSTTSRPPTSTAPSPSRRTPCRRDWASGCSSCRGTATRRSTASTGTSAYGPRGSRRSGPSPHAGRCTSVRTVLRFLVGVLAWFVAAAVGLLVANLVLDGMHMDASSYVEAVVLIFAVLQGVLTPLALGRHDGRAPALLGGAGLVSSFLALLVTDLISSGLTIERPSTWVFATLILWVASMVAVVPAAPAPAAPGGRQVPGAPRPLRPPHGTPGPRRLLPVPCNSDPRH